MSFWGFESCFKHLASHFIASPPPPQKKVNFLLVLLVCESYWLWNHLCLFAPQTSRLLNISCKPAVFLCVQPLVASLLSFQPLFFFHSPLCIHDVKYISSQQRGSLQYRWAPSRLSVTDRLVYFLIPKELNSELSSGWQTALDLNLRLRLYWSQFGEVLNLLWL